MVRFFLYIVFCVLATAQVLAAKVDTVEAKRVAFEFMSQRTLLDDSSELVLVNSGYEYIYALNVKNGGGFVLVSADNSAKPIIGYSLSESFVADQNGVTNGWLASCNGIIGGISDDEPVNSEWTALGNENSLKATSTVVEPLLVSKWTQISPYNYVFPDNDENGKAIVGCVAVAMGQVLRYWKYPKTGCSYKIVDDARYGELTVYFDSVNYDWDNMPETLTDSSPEEQINAVSTLLYHCAVGASSVFGNKTQGTGARIFMTNDYPYDNGQYSLMNNFKYDTEMVGELRSAYTNSAWRRKLREELSNGRPVIYSGTDSTSTYGHCFVIDGCDADGYFHVNWGWGGGSNGYFLLDSLIPTQNSDYSYTQAALIKVHPVDSLYEESGVADAVSVDDVSVSFYPNPSTDMVTVNVYGNLLSNAQLSVCSAEGSVIYSSAVSQAENNFSVSKWSPGTYLVCIRNGSAKMTARLIVR